MAAGPRCIASTRTGLKTPLTTVLLLLRASAAAITYQRPLFTEPLLSNGCCIAAYLAVVA
jgi:hypothetical protein